MGWAGQGPQPQALPRFTASYPLILSCTALSEPFIVIHLIAENSLFFLFFFLSTPGVEVVNKCALNIIKLCFLLLLHFHFNSVAYLLYLHIKCEKQGHDALLKLHFHLFGLHLSLDGEDTRYTCHMTSLFMADTVMEHGTFSRSSWGTSESFSTLP